MIDHFVNKGELYEQMGPLLSDLFDKIGNVDLRLADEVKKAYCHEGLRRKIGWVLKDAKEAQIDCQKVLDILRSVKQIHGKTRAVVDQDQKRIKLLSVIRGGLYNSAGGKTGKEYNDRLSKEFNAWRHEQSKEGGNHDEV